MVEDECIEHRCAFYQHMIGQNPQTGAAFDTWDCSHRWVPLLLIENSQQQRQTAAAVESLRNVNFEGGQGLVAALLTAATQRKSEVSHERSIADSSGGNPDSSRIAAVGSQQVHPDGREDQTDPERRGDSSRVPVATVPTS